jgi:hypothetical protein
MVNPGRYESRAWMSETLLARGCSSVTLQYFRTHKKDFFTSDVKLRFKVKLRSIKRNVHSSTEISRQRM